MAGIVYEGRKRETAVRIMEHLLLRYGYALLFLGVMVEGETCLLVASFLAHQGYFSIVAVIAVAVAANTAIDQIYYRVARSRGRSWLERRYGNHPRFAQLEAAVARHGRWLLLGSRFAY